jgi:hypothetical protein
MRRHDYLRRGRQLSAEPHTVTVLPNAATPPAEAAAEGIYVALEGLGDSLAEFAGAARYRHHCDSDRRHPDRGSCQGGSTPIHGYQAVNVEPQQRNPSSLLHWTRRMITLCKQNPAFGLGSYHELGGTNPAVLAYLRAYRDDVVLCVNNLSRHAQATHLDLTAWAGYTPVELAGGHPFPRIGKRRYLITLGPYGFYWLHLTACARWRGQLA